MLAAMEGQKVSLAKGTLVATFDGWTPAEKIATYQRMNFDEAQEVSFRPVSGANVSTSVVASRYQEWDALGGRGTRDIRIGDRVAINVFDFGYDPFQWINGFMFGCGVSDPQALPKNLSHFKNRLSEIQDAPSKPYLPKDANGRGIGSWMHGLYDATPGKLYKCVNLDTVKWIVDHLVFGGLVASGEIHFRRRPFKEKGIIKSWIETYEVQLAKCSTFNGWKVHDIQTVKEPVEMYELPKGVHLLQSCLKVGMKEAKDYEKGVKLEYTDNPFWKDNV